MARTVRFSISLDGDLLEKLDEFILKEKLPSRSRLISELINKYLTEEKSIRGDNIVAGVISFIYNHNKRLIADILTSIQHKYHNVIVSSQHVHLTDDICFEIIIVKGKGNDVKDLYRDIKKVRGVLNSYLNITSAT